MLTKKGEGDDCIYSRKTGCPVGFRKKHNNHHHYISTLHMLSCMFSKKYSTLIIFSQDLHLLDIINVPSLLLCL